MTRVLGVREGRGCHAPCWQTHVVVESCVGLDGPEVSVVSLPQTVLQRKKRQRDAWNPITCYTACLALASQVRTSRYLMTDGL